MSTVVALAGRRIDAPDADTIRFPLGNAAAVADRIAGTLQRLGAGTLVSSAACGADLLALEAAGALGMRRVVVLPFEPRRFRAESVTDRPGGTERWGPAFDRVLRELADRDLVVLDGDTEGTEAFAAANERILGEALARASDARVRAVALVVWDGAPRGGGDLTAHFAEAARRRGLAVEEVSTL
ncbi:MAG TPA: hypothetical protein VFS20_20495 [Longimicrobium sp.]|nr:hypothetical protein [Longimicrobium sp.]